MSATTDYKTIVMHQAKVAVAAGAYGAITAKDGDRLMSGVKSMLQSTVAGTAVAVGIPGATHSESAVYSAALIAGYAYFTDRALFQEQPLPKLLVVGVIAAGLTYIGEKFVAPAINSAMHKA